MNSRARNLKRIIKIETDSECEVDEEIIDITDEVSTKYKANKRLKKEKTEVKTEFNSQAEEENKKLSSVTRKRKLQKKPNDEDFTDSDDSDYEYSSKIKQKRLNVKKGKTSTKKNKVKSKSEDVKDELQNKSKNEVKPKTKVTSEYQTLWEDYELLAEYQNLDLNVSRNVMGLFNEGCTIPFIARYRKNVTNNMTPELLREVKHNYDQIMTLKSRAQTVLNIMKKSGKLDLHLEKSILSARSIEEVEHIYAPFKPGSKRTLAERARALGLQEPALKILGNEQVNLYNYINRENEELDTYEKVEKGIVHIIAHVISTDIKVLTYSRKLKTEGNFGMEVKKLNKRSTKTKETKSKEPDESKYETYFDFKLAVKFVKPHQVLAINRGEAQKILSVKITVPDFILRKFTAFCKGQFSYYTGPNNVRRKILDESISDSYTRLMQPFLVREIRAELKLNAEKASYDVFCNNLKHLLLTPPIKGRAILGIDPGYSNGCKVAVISPTGVFLDSNVLYLHSKKQGDQDKILRDMLQKYSCNLIALGNGTACRETETWLSDLIAKNYFSPLDVSYIIVSENGASIYSCSPEARKEFPSIDPNIISAVSLSRRIQEPLAEFVKVEPKHLGVGMYQHDLPKKKLEEALDEVVSECVSFVGVDLNTASQCLLRRIAGLSDKRATKIIEYRESNGPFVSRKELTNISGIGSKIFEQCAGFLRVGPITVEEESAFYKNPKSNKLDCTIIHPESYELTSKLVRQLGLHLKDIGTADFIAAMKQRTAALNLGNLCESLGTCDETLKLILDALTKPLNYDLRNDCSKVPLFKKGITNLSDLRVDTVLTGRVSNVTHFGSFVDIGVGCDGLIHVSKMAGETLQTGNTVEVKVLNIDIPRRRIGLALVRII